MGFSVAFVLATIVHVITSQGPPQEFTGGPRFPPNLPEQCRRPPQDVNNPHECCKIPPFFTDEEFQECGFRKLNEEGPPQRPQGPPDCSKQLCMLKKHDLLKDETTIDHEKLAAFLDKWTSNHTEFQSAIVSAKELCVGRQLPGPPQICEANKIVFCISSTLFAKCPIWDESDGCQKLKNHMEECTPFFQNNLNNSN
ncbi:general odorant-binding protein 67-like [Galleria mellonella]|uniref:General odorant-binding protein 67-like n=1 Tax=Galleria mellonella TaxID=7137 RepID=A0A6J1W8V7_GALME|nr:general odorant-binding protein 67-like [Galleria mellonella]